jgi:hypothetical protein
MAPLRGWAGSAAVPDNPSLVLLCGPRSGAENQSPAGGRTGCRGGRAPVEELGGARAAAAGLRSVESRGAREWAGPRACGRGSELQAWVGGVSVPGTAAEGGGTGGAKSGAGPVSAEGGARRRGGSAGQESSECGCRGPFTASLTASAVGSEPLASLAQSPRPPPRPEGQPRPILRLGGHNWGQSGPLSLRRPHLARIWNRPAHRAGARACPGPATPGALPGAGAASGAAGPRP